MTWHDMLQKKTTYPKHSFWLILRYFKVTSILFRYLLLRSLLVRKDYTSYTKNILEAKIHCECFGFTIWQLFSNAKINQLQIALRIQHHLDLGSVVYRRLMDVGNGALEQKHSYVSKMCSNMQSLCKKCDKGVDTWTFIIFHSFSFYGFTLVASESNKMAKSKRWFSSFLLKLKMEPENHQLEKGNHLPNLLF